MKSACHRPRLPPSSEARFTFTRIEGAAAGRSIITRKNSLTRPAWASPIDYARLCKKYARMVSAVRNHNRQGYFTGSEKNSELAPDEGRNNGGPCRFLRRSGIAGQFAALVGRRSARRAKFNGSDE